MHSKIWSLLNQKNNCLCFQTIQRRIQKRKEIHSIGTEYTPYYASICWSFSFRARWLIFNYLGFDISIEIRIIFNSRNGVSLESSGIGNWRWIESNFRFVISIKYNSTVKHACITLITCIILSHCSLLHSRYIPNTGLLPLINTQLNKKDVQNLFFGLWNAWVCDSLFIE